MRFSLPAVLTCTIVGRGMLGRNELGRALGCIVSLAFVLSVPFAKAAAPRSSEQFKVRSSEQGGYLGSVSVKAKRQEVRLLEDSYLYNIDYGNRQSLYNYIVRINGMYDAVVRMDIYNLNYRGINTSPVNGRMPFSIVTDELYSANRYRAPRHVYLLPYIAHFEGVGRYSELQSGPGGVVSTTSVLPSKKQHGEILLDYGQFRQKAAGALSGKIYNSPLLYGLSFNYTQRPGEYKNASGRQSKVNGKSIDGQRGIYGNGYIIYPL